MKRFHYVNNKGLERNIAAICQLTGCNDLTELFRLLFISDKDFIRFTDAYCISRVDFERVFDCDVHCYVYIPEEVFNSIKKCHIESNTFSIARIFRSILVRVVECFIIGGFEYWQMFKMEVFESCKISEENDIVESTSLFLKIGTRHMSERWGINTGKLSFYNTSNEFLGYLLL